MAPAASGRRHVIFFSVESDEEAFLGRSLDSIVQHSDPATEIVVLCSQPSAIGQAGVVDKESLEDERITIVPIGSGCHHPLMKALQVARERYGNRDILYLRCGLEVPYGWDDRLEYGAYADASIGTASPLCDISPLFQLLWVPVAIDVRVTNEILCRFARRESVQVPTFLDSCVYIKREAIEAIWSSGLRSSAAGSGDFASYLAKAIESAGYAHALCDHLYVQKHVLDAAQRRLERALSESVDTANRLHPLAELRYRVNDALQRKMQGEPCVRPPVQLHVVHGWGGGVERWVRDFVRHDTSRRNLILKASGTWGRFGQRIDLYDSAEMQTPIRSWELYAPIKGIAIVNLQYRELLESIREEFGIEVILVSSLIGHSLDVLDSAAATLMVLHDYLPFCPAVNIFFDGICEYCDAERLESCFLGNVYNQFFTNVSAQEWLDIRKRFFSLTKKNDLHFVVPTKSVETHWRRLAPELSEVLFHVIPHGVSAGNKITRDPMAAKERKLRVLVLGSLAENKGGRLLKEVLPGLVDAAEFFLVGCGKDGAFFASCPEIAMIPHYERDELDKILADIDPDLGLLASIVPETFSYTLSELIGLGIPPLVPRRGSFEDRVLDGETGFFFEPEKAGLASRIRALAGDREKIEAVRKKLTDTTDLTEGDMISRYHGLAGLPRFSAMRYRRLRLPAPIEFAESVPEEDAQDPAIYPDVRTAREVPVLIIDPQATFSEVYREFGGYVRSKLEASPRFKPWQKRTLRKLVALLFPKTVTT